MNILIAEDDRISRKTLEMYAKKMGYEPILAEDGLQAYELWQKQRPRIILTDWNMPQMDGIELCRAVRANESDDYTYIIMITSRDNTDDLVVGFESGVDDYLAKPVKRAELAVRLKASERIFSLQSKDTVIFSLAKLAETRDPETGLHLERIQGYCRVISEFMLQNFILPEIVTRRFIDDIYSTSPLHDIGKVGIADNILLKPGRLTAEEFNAMKAHSTIGFETLRSALERDSKASYLKMAAEIALSHHEKWSGEGYPQGLKGEEIPLSARIVAIADVYDALTTKRVYKPAFSHERSLEIILEGKGSHFDPHLSEVFVACEKDFRHIMESMQETEPPA